MKNAPRTENLQASLLNFVVNHISSEISEALKFGHRDEERKMCLFQLRNVSTSLTGSLKKNLDSSCRWRELSKGLCLVSPQLNFSPVVIEYSGSFIILPVTIKAPASPNSWFNLMRCVLNFSAYYQSYAYHINTNHIKWKSSNSQLACNVYKGI